MIALERPTSKPDGRRTKAAQIVPCSQAQQRFWFEEQLHPGNPGLNVAVRWQLEGDLPQDILAEAWRRLAARHASLRTSFTAADGEPIGIVEPSIDFEIRTIDLRGYGESQGIVEADRWADIEAHDVFDLSVAPLLRATRVVLTDRRSILLVTAHHVICDGWSIGILAHEMGTICAALSLKREPVLRELPIDYSDYAAWERECSLDGGVAAETELARQYLNGYSQFELLPDYARPRLQTSNGKITSRMLERELTDALAGFARSNGCTLFVAALSALFALLHHHSGETDITLGTQVAGRDDEDLEGIVGCFINTVALRGDLRGDPSFVELLERTRSTVGETFELRNVPLERLIEAVKPKRDLSRNALFSVNFIFQRSFIKNASYGDFDLIDLPSRSSGALYDLNIFMVERPEGWRISCEYNTDLFAGGTIDGMLERFSNVLRSVVADPTQRVSGISVLSARELAAVTIDANRTQQAYPREATLPQLFSAQASRTPAALAVTCGDSSLTYAELDGAANRLARELVQRGIGRGMQVGILLDRSTSLVVALLAVVKTGAAYIPLDPAFPAERLAYICANAQLAAIVTRAHCNNLTTSHAACIDIDADRASIERQSSDPLVESPAPGDVAYVIYTSGSTGMPKGVRVGHRALTNFLWAMRERPGLSAADTLVAVTTISFDIAALEIFLPLVVGARVVLATERDVMDGDALLELVRRHAATIVQATPITWQLLLDAGWHGDPPLKALCGGEAFPRALADALLERGADLWNMYGPTETTIWSSVARVEPSSQPVRIGPPIANTQFYVLDPNRNPVPPGVAGELYIGGDGVALGYHARPELTEERFVPDPFGDSPQAKLYRTGDIVRSRDSGTFEFLGRTDHQVKLRGFRIELGEIEAALERQPDVAAAVVTVDTDDSGAMSMYAYVAPQAGVVPDASWPGALRSALATFLPTYMLPNAIVSLPALPRTPNGKIDRRALPANGICSLPASREAPRTPTEIALGGLVATLLKRSSVGRSEELFALGFHSLLAVRLIAQIAQTFGVKLPLRAVFDNSTVAALAERLIAGPESTGQAQVAPSIVRLNAEGSRRPFLFFHNDVWSGGMYTRRIANVLGPAQPVLAIAAHGTADLPILPTIEAMAADYIERLRSVQPAGPYRLGGFCAGGLVAYEVARTLRARGDIVELLVLVNASAPPRRAVLFGDALLRRIGLDSRLDPLLRETLCWNVVRLFDNLGYGPERVGRFLAGRLRSVWANLDPGAVPRMNEPEPFERRRGTVETENYFSNLIAAYTYHPAPYDGEVTLLWGTEQPADRTDPSMGWAALARHVNVLPLSGGHVTPLRAGVDELANILDRLLRANTASCTNIPS